MASSRTLRRVALVRIDVSEERSASFIRMTIIGELGITLAVTSNRRTLRATRRNIPEDAILHRHRRENLKSYRPSLYLYLDGLRNGCVFCRVVIDTDWLFLS
jgi:hypothetical protein